jgi:hypothetical protein
MQCLLSASSRLQLSWTAENKKTCSEKDEVVTEWNFVRHISIRCV